MSCNGNCNQGRNCDCGPRKERQMNTGNAPTIDQTLALLVSLAEEYDPAPEGKTLTPNMAIIDFLHGDDVRQIFNAITEKLAALESQPVPVEPSRFYIDDGIFVLAGDYKELQSALKRAQEEIKLALLDANKNPCSCVADGDNGSVAHLCQWHKDQFGKAYKMQNMADSITVENFTKLSPEKLRLFIAHNIQESTARKKAEAALKRAQEERDKWKAEADGQFQYAGRLLDELNKVESVICMLTEFDGDETGDCGDRLANAVKRLKERAEKAEADLKAAEQNVSDLMAEVAQTGALLMKAEATNRRMVELLKEPSEGMIAAGYPPNDERAQSWDVTEVFKAMSAELLKEVGE